MDTNDLKLLINKYWEGETSLAEEESLKEWFSNNPAPEELESESKWFTELNQLRSATLSENFDQMILSKINTDQEIQSKPDNAGKNVLWNSSWLNWKVAAVVSGIIVASVVLKNPFGSSSTTSDTYDNPQDAYEATKAILMTISSNMNKGKKYTQQLSKFSEAQERVAATGSGSSGEGSD